MTASDLFKAGRLQEALQAQLQEVKDHPADQACRLFLFELAVFAGDLDRARKQIDALRYDDPGLEATRQRYRVLLDAEQARRRLFERGERPRFLGEPPPHAELRLAALDRLRNGEVAPASELLDRAERETPAIAGLLNGKPFTALRDEDQVLGPVLEVLANGNYFWVPLEQVVSLSAAPPRFPRDLYWLPARLETAAEKGDVFLPALYAGSHARPDDAVKLGRLTEILAPGGSPARGAGMHSFLADGEPVGLLEWRELRTGAGEPQV
jgi:type VI secretion system protein ImpE